MTSPVLSIRPDDPRLRWEGAISLQHTAEWLQPWRLPVAERSLFPPVALQERAAMPAGVRITFRTDTQTIAGRIECQAESSPLDLVCDGQRIATAELAGREAFRFDDLPPGEKLIELWLPQFGEFRLRGLELSPGAQLVPHIDRRPRWVTYGSSITQCRTARRPTETWPAVVARAQDYHLTCLGFGGQCHLDVMVARLIRDLPADFLSFCLGINIFGAASLGPRAFQSSIIGFVQIVREKHPDTPLAILSPIMSAPDHEEQVNAVGFTLPAMRTEVASAVEALQAHGDRNIYFVDGFRIFGPNDAHLLADHVHPSADGYLLMGDRFIGEVAKPIFAKSE
ncbi:MAG TPA: SGNH/GDSL hydrolase family protein [Chloroflexota bacterium]|nr:SGNH/GDSL hydrolase family protein [Chloroflexota bacterium]